MAPTDDGPDARTALMEATHAVLTAEGFAGLTTQRVADEAGYSQALVHYHYDTKPDLVVAFIEWLRANEAEWLTADDEGDPRQRLDRFVDAQLSIPRDAEHGRFNVAMLELQAAAAHDDRYREALAGFAADVRERLAAILADGVSDGSFRAIDPDATARFLLAALQGAVAETLTLDADATDAVPAAVETYLERVVYAEAT